VHEPALGGSPTVGAHLAVIPHDRDARPLEGARELIDRNGRGAVDDPRSTQRSDASVDGAGLRRTRHDFYTQAKIRAVG
jgi:hypothetical protein